MCPGSVTCSHIPITLCHSSRHTQVPIFPVHVMCSRSRVITQPDTKILNLNRCLLSDLFQRNNLTRRLFELFQLTQEIPETRLGHNHIRGEDPHFVERSSLLLLCGQLAPDHLKFLQLKHTRTNFKSLLTNECEQKYCCRNERGTNTHGSLLSTRVPHNE